MKQDELASKNSDNLNNVTVGNSTPKMKPLSSSPPTTTTKQAAPSSSSNASGSSSSSNGGGGGGGGGGGTTTACAGGEASKVASSDKATGSGGGGGGEEEDDNKEMIGGCCVCSDDTGYVNNLLVYCDGQGCQVAVHQGCYGIHSVPEGDWFCKACEHRNMIVATKANPSEITKIVCTLTLYPHHINTFFCCC